MPATAPQTEMRKGRCGHGWFEYTGRYHVWKAPLGVRNRTMAKNLAHKTEVDDSSKCSLASADYLLLFRKRGQSHRVSAARARAADAPASLALAPGVVSGADELDLAPGLYTLAVSASAHHWLFCCSASRTRTTTPTPVPPRLADPITVGFNVP